jgi:hypothetical protein
MPGTSWNTWLNRLSAGTRRGGSPRRRSPVRPGFERLEDRVTPVVTNQQTGEMFATITAAINDAETVNGHTLLIGNQANPYIEPTINVNKALTLQGESRAGVIIAPAVEDSQDDSAFGGTANTGLLVTVSGVTIRNLTIDGDANPALTAGRNNFRNGIATNVPLNNLVVENVSVDAVFRRGILIFDAGTGHSITGSSVNDVELTGGNGHGISTFGGDLTARNNTITNVLDGSGILVQSDLQPVNTRSPVVTIAGNTISGVDIGINIASPGAGSVVGGPNAADRNTIDLSLVANGDIGILSSAFNTGSTITIQNNLVTATGADSAIWLINNPQAAAPVVTGNILTATNSTGANPGEGVGILLTDDTNISASATGPSFATITGNQLNGFTRGIDLFRNGGVDGQGNPVAGGFQLTATIGGANAADANTITGGVTAVRLFDADGATNGNRATASLVNNTLIAQTGTNVQVNGGALTAVTQNTITGGPIGIDVATGGTLGPVSQNFLTGHATNAILIQASAGAVGAVSNNDLSANGVALNNAAAAALDASGNWFGVNTSAGVQGEVAGTVDFTPFLDVGTDTTPGTPGFQGNFATLHVDDAGAQVGTVGRIQEGVNLAAGTPPLTVIVEAGTYTENVNVNKTLTLRGATGTAADVTIQGAAGDAVTASADGVTISDLRITGAQGAAIRANAVNGLTVTDVQLVNNTGTAFNLTNVAGTVTLADLTVTGNGGGGTIDGSGATTVDFTTTTGVVDDQVTLTATQITLVRAGAAQQPINYTDVGTFNVRGDDGSDTFTVTPSATTAYSIFGGPPTVTPGDTLIYNAGGQAVVVNQTAGTITGAGVQPVTFTGIETRQILNTTPPVAANDSFTVAANGTLNQAAPGVLANDTSVDPTTLTATLVSNVTTGTLTLNPNGSFTYTPPAGFSGTATFTYRANDSAGQSNVATVTITVTPPPVLPPVANPDTFQFTVTANRTLIVPAPGVLANDTDPQGLPLTAVLVSSTSNGTLTLNANGGFTYTVNPGFTGTDTFTYRASNGTAQSNVATITINVTAGPVLTPSQCFVMQVYRDLLLREGDAGGVQFWVNLLDSGTFTRFQVVIGFTNSIEYRDLQLNDIYNRLLRRTPDATGRTDFQAFLARGGTLEQVEAQVLASQEYFQFWGGNTVPGYVNALYRDTLGRAGDPGGVAFWVAQLTGKNNRLGVATSFLRSPEEDMNEIARQYRQFLRRDPDAGGAAFFLNQLQRNPSFTEQTLTACLLESTEYFNRFCAT